MRNIDFSSWNTLFSTVLGLVLVSLVAVGIRLVFMQTLQRRRERENRQVNERLKTLIAAYKVLGGSFTGELAVNPAHLRDLRRTSRLGTPATETDTPPADAAAEAEADAAAFGHAPEAADIPHEVADVGITREVAGEGIPRDADMDIVREAAGSDRKRRIRDAVEAALSDVILLGTEEQVRLAAQAAADMTAGRTVRTAALVVSLRNFIRRALDLEPVPADVTIPDQGPLRIATGSGGKGGGRSDGERGGAGRGGGRGGGGGMGAGAGGMGLVLGRSGRYDDSSPDRADD